MIKYSFEIINKIKTIAYVLIDKIYCIKSRIMLEIYSLCGFESFNLLDIFDDWDYEIKEPKSNDELLDELFENEDFKKVYNRILDHFFKHVKSKKEELVVVSKENKIIFRKTGTAKTVHIPLELHMLRNFHDILIMIHNHPNGGVIPSENDVCTIVNFQSVFGAITSSNHIGILENKNIKPFVNDVKTLFLKDFELYKINIFYKIYLKWPNIFNLIDGKFDDYALDYIKMKLFSNYTTENIDELITDFNYRMDKYNVKLIYINKKDF